MAPTWEMMAGAGFILAIIGWHETGAPWLRRRRRERARWRAYGILTDPRGDRKASVRRTRRG